ncbi:hypothetical protein ACFLTX_01425 [Chloroflexota bacterium]
MILSIVLVIWLIWPYSRKTGEIIFQPGELVIESKDAYDNNLDQLGAIHYVPGSLKVILDWQPIMRKGGLDEVRLHLVQEDQSNVGTRSLDLPIEPSSIEFKNIYDDYSLMAMTRFDMLNVSLDPPGESGVGFPQGENVVFHWRISSRTTGTMQGTVWFYLVAFPKDGGVSIKRAVSAQDLEIKVISILGIEVIYLWIAAGLAGFFGISRTLGIHNWKFLKSSTRFRKTILRQRK